MKKSTLITTIAMIVVVVVALSTATYAWFSSATTTSASDNITTTAQANWIIMGGKAVAGESENAGKDVISYSSSNALQLTMLDGLYSPNAVIAGLLNNASNSALFTPTPFFTATQDGTGLSNTAKASTQPSVDPLPDEDTIPSAANYVRVINTYSEPQSLVLTITVITTGDTDSDFYAANAFSTYVTWFKAGESASGEGAITTATNSANTKYYWGTVAGSTTGKDDGYYEATLHSDTPEAVSNLTYVPNASSKTIDEHNIGARAGTSADPKVGYTDASTTNVTIGGQVINTGYYYQIKITIADSSHKLASNAAVNIAFYAWFDGWALDNTGANSDATVYYEFGAN